MCAAPEPKQKPEETPTEAADAFAAQAVKSALMPARDGLQVFEDLARKPKPKN